jgi:hypothetical protein
VVDHGHDGRRELAARQLALEVEPAPLTERGGQARQVEPRSARGDVERVPDDDPSVERLLPVPVERGDADRQVELAADVVPPLLAVVRDEPAGGGGGVARLQHERPVDDTQPGREAVDASAVAGKLEGAGGGRGPADEGEHVNLPRPDEFGAPQHA